MKLKVGSYLRDNILDLVVAYPKEPISIKTASSYELKVPSFFESLSIEDEKNLEQATDFVQKSLSSQKLSELETNIIIPDERCSLQIIKLPLVSEKEIISAIELQSEEFVPYPIEKASFDYQVLSVDKANNVMYLLLIVALKENIDKVANFLLNVGLYPVGLETETTALIRLVLNSYFKFEDKFSMVMNVGNSSTQITILNHSQKQLVTTNSLNMGNHFFYKALQNNLNVPTNSAKQMFANLKTADVHYEKVIKPVFAEYAKQVQQILMVALEKIGTLPTRLYLYSSQADNAYSLLFKDHPALSQYNTVSLNSVAPNALTVALPPNLSNRLGYYLVPIGAVT